VLGFSAVKRECETSRLDARYREREADYAQWKASHGLRAKMCYTELLVNHTMEKDSKSEGVQVQY
jgi:hypothetical protein